jgi:hypothetical protein
VASNVNGEDRGAPLLYAALLRFGDPLARDDPLVDPDVGELAEELPAERRGCE